MTEQEFIIETKKLGIDITKEQLDKLQEFYNLMIDKNKVMNLTRITEEEDVYLKHFYDSLTLVKAVDLTKDLTLCDVGTGAGFPGIVLKIIFPNLKITLIDSLQKRINYLNEVIDKLNLKDIEAIHARVEDYIKNNNQKFDIVTSRAVANLKKLSELTLPLLNENGTFIAMKANLTTEIEDSKQIINKLNCQIKDIISFNLIKEESVRNLVVITKNK